MNHPMTFEENTSLIIPQIQPCMPQQHLEQSVLKMSQAGKWLTQAFLSQTHQKKGNIFNRMTKHFFQYFYSCPLRPAEEKQN